MIDISSLNYKELIALEEAIQEEKKMNTFLVTWLIMSEQKRNLVLNVLYYRQHNKHPNLEIEQVYRELMPTFSQAEKDLYDFTVWAKHLPLTVQWYLKQKK